MALPSAALAVAFCLVTKSPNTAPSRRPAIRGPRDGMRWVRLGGKVNNMCFFFFSGENSLSSWVNG